ncbi:MAG TPA: LpxD N-terminal domain-containing protein, partial [Flavobacterium sp.]
MKTYTIEEINSVLKGTVYGSTPEKISAPEQIESAVVGQITFIGSKKYERLWEKSNASAAIVNESISIEPGENKAFIKVKNADLAMSQVLELFAPPLPVFDEDIHPTAVIHSTAKIGKGAKIGAGAFVGRDVMIGDEVTIYPNVTILDESTI